MRTRWILAGAHALRDGRDGRDAAAGKMSIAEQVRTGYHPEEY